MAGNFDNDARMDGDAKLNLKTRFWVESSLALLSGLLCLLTLIRKDWIEAVFGVEPDGGSGAAEWAIVAVLAAMTIAFGALARVTRRRATTTG